ncbi:cytochrome d ubiquinol oxidase subunit II [Rhizobium lusitanum]|uniref:Cytochrome d ubiquinol oxidase subunit II n=1 Tax=Rhizobium lusitanum TaxID=293958 RepID=A0A6L9UI16_9HYPH|nr:cytochrome d ubiquinol oxidase subunit II [Rhizobium lusitanum]NEI74032.1 cytochrome d ubiquinol oxidase subunit II [Rhizobium lusitanum]
MTIDLSFVWAAIIAFAVFAYIILDGFDLGIGIIFPAFPKRHDRDLMTNTIAPVWDGNETWLVMGGGGLMAVFPPVYSIVFPALYLPIIIMLISLIFRGVAFEFRWRTRPGSHLWDIAFWLGSSLAAIMQGITLGTLIQGIKVENYAYAGGTWDWLSLFSVLCGLALLAGYALLGATWLNLKTSGDVQARCQSLAKHLTILLLALIGVVSIWTPFINEIYFQRWFQWPTAFFSSFVPLLLAICACLVLMGLQQGKDLQPFLATLGVFVLSYIGLGISFYPYIIPGALTIREAAAPLTSLQFLLAGTAVLMPTILSYTGYAYWVFRGKVRPEDGYH